MQNISFKGIFLFPTIEKVTPENRSKVDQGMRMAEQFFPNNDVFLGGTDKGELTIHVQKKNPLHYLLDPSVAQAINMPDEQIYAYVNDAIMMQMTHDELWGEKPPYQDDVTSGIDKMKPKDVVMKLHDVLTEFNQKYPETLN